jgi:hypothetical protein
VPIVAAAMMARNAKPAATRKAICDPVHADALLAPLRDSRAFPTRTGVGGTCGLRSGMLVLGSAAGPAGPDTRSVRDENRMSVLA